MSEDVTGRVEKAIRAIAAGSMVAVVDDEDRENEGDLIMAASKATPEQIAFILRHTCGILCAPVSKTLAQQLNLAPMVGENDAPLGTAFTVSIDYREGLTTGISAAERCGTLRALGNPNVGAADFVRPGHVFPLIARDGGVLMRSGHTEAAVDLCKLAGLAEAGAICELVNDDGTVMKGAEINNFCEAHDLSLISVDDLIAYRRARERLVEVVGERTLSTWAGEARAIAYRSVIDGVEHLALVFGDVHQGEAVPVRLHRSSILDDVFGERTAIDQCFKLFQARGQGVLVYLREGGEGVAKESILREAQAARPEEEPAHRQNWHDVGLGAQILRDLGISRVELLSSREFFFVGLDGFGLTIDKTTPLEG